MSRIAVVTGASGGIGAAAASALLGNGYTVVGISRKAPKDCGFRYIEADVCDETAVKAAFAEIENSYGSVDLLVNNAGFGISGAAEFTDIDSAKKQFDVNLFGTLLCAQAALPIMRKNKGGRIINISSVAAVIPIPFQSFYSAVKAAVNSLTLALRSEVAPYGIRVSAVMPGDVKTGFTEAREKSVVGADVYPSLSRAVAVMENDEQNGMPPEKVARTILKAAQARRPRALYTVGAKYKLFVFLMRILPTSLCCRIVASIYK